MDKPDWRAYGALCFDVAGSGDFSSGHSAVGSAASEPKAHQLTRSGVRTKDWRSLDLVLITRFSVAAALANFSGRKNSPRGASPDGGASRRTATPSSSGLGARQTRLSGSR